jgi:hypothetical protein
MGRVETTGWIGVRMGTSNTTTVVAEGVEGFPLSTEGIGIKGLPVPFELD